MLLLFIPWFKSEREVGSSAMRSTSLERNLNREFQLTVSTSPVGLSWLLWALALMMSSLSAGSLTEETALPVTLDQELQLAALMRLPHSVPDGFNDITLLFVLLLGSLKGVGDDMGHSVKIHSTYQPTSMGFSQLISTGYFKYLI